MRAAFVGLMLAGSVGCVWIQGGVAAASGAGGAPGFMLAQVMIAQSGAPAQPAPPLPEAKPESESGTPDTDSDADAGTDADSGTDAVTAPLPADKPATAGPPLPDERPVEAPVASPLPAERPDETSDRGTDAATAPLPAEKPASAGAPQPAPQPAARPAGAPVVPLPQDKPASGGIAPTDAAADPPGAPAGAAAVPLPQAPPDSGVGDDPPSTPPPIAETNGLSPACPAIEEGRVLGRPLPPIRDDGNCDVAAVYAIGFVGTDRAVALEPEAVLNCAITERLDEFVAKVVEPAAEEIMRTALTGLSIAGSYVCRTRNGQPDAPPSEHGKANAIDISTFTFADGRTVSVAQDWTGEGEAAEFLRLVHEKACGPFTTVLGPEADSFHQSHLHFDLQRRGADGQTTFCQ